MKPSKTPTFRGLPGPSIITEVAMPLMATNGRQAAAVGTAVMLTSGVALTARHVLEEFCILFEGRVPSGPNPTTSFSLSAVMVCESGQAGISFAVRQFYTHSSHDLALLWLKQDSPAPTGWSLRTPRLDLLPPRRGERVVGFGYPKLDVDLSDSRIAITHSASTSVGEVANVYPIQRDRAMLPFPCFEVNARFDGGMSGGPVFNDDGHLCGIVCSSFAGAEQDDEHTSFVSSLWPLLGLPISIELENQPRPTYPAHLLFERKLIHGRGWDSFRILPAPAGLAGWYLERPTQLLSGRASGEGVD